MFVFLLSFYKLQHIYSEANFTLFDDFGFEKGADFSIYLDSISGKDEISLFLLTKAERSKLPGIITDSIALCNASESYKYKYFNADVKNQTLSGKIEDAGVYYPIAAACNTKIKSSKLDYHIVFSFHNPTTNLDIRQVPLLKILPAILLVCTILIALWSLNWYNHKNVFIKLHSFISLTFFTTYMMFITDFLLLLRLNHHDTDFGLQIFSIIFSLLSRGLFFSTLLLAAKGWCIIKDTIYLREIAASLLYSFLFMSLQKIIEYIYLGKYAIYAMAIALLFIALFIYELVQSINQASLHIMAHLLVIQNEGIDAESTPIYLKHRMYVFLQKTIILGCILALICMVITSVTEAPLWASATLQYISEIIILTAFGCIFRLRGTDSAGYSMVGDSNLTSSIEVALDDIKEFNLGKEGKQWQEGMELPAQPTIVSTPAVIVLSSPDGTEALKAEMTPNQNEV